MTAITRIAKPVSLAIFKMDTIRGEKGAVTRDHIHVYIYIYVAWSFGVLLTERIYVCIYIYHPGKVELRGFTSISTSRDPVSHHINIIIICNTDMYIYVCHVILREKHLTALSRSKTRKYIRFSEVTSPECNVSEYLMSCTSAASLQ